MNIEEWWPTVEPATRAWLVANNGDVLPAETVVELTAAGRSASTDQLADDEIDWIEAVANDEEPGDEKGSELRTLGRSVQGSEY